MNSIGSTEILPTSSEQQFEKLTLVERLQVKLSVIEFQRIPCCRCTNVVEFYIVVLLLVSCTINILSSSMMMCFPFQEIEDLSFEITFQSQWNVYVSIIHLARVVSAFLVVVGIILRSPILLSSFIPLSSFAAGAYMYYFVKLMLNLIIHQSVVQLFDSIFVVMRTSIVILDLCHILLIMTYVLWILHSKRRLCIKL